MGSQDYFSRKEPTLSPRVRDLNEEAPGLRDRNTARKTPHRRRRVLRRVSPSPGRGHFLSSRRRECSLSHSSGVPKVREETGLHTTQGRYASFRAPGYRDPPVNRGTEGTGGCGVGWTRGNKGRIVDSGSWGRIGGSLPPLVPVGSISGTKGQGLKVGVPPGTPSGPRDVERHGLARLQSGPLLLRRGEYGAFPSSNSDREISLPRFIRTRLVF